MFYYEVLEGLYSRKIRYMIVGGLAVNIHGVPRMTNDIDILLSMDKQNILAFTDLVKNLGYIPRLPVNPALLADSETLNQWIKEKNLKAFSFYNSKDNYKVIDIVLDQPLDFEKSFQNKSISNLKDFEIYSVSIDDLILMKQASGRERDINDINLLEKAKLLKAE